MEREIEQAIGAAVLELYPEANDDWWCPNCNSYVIATYEENCSSCGMCLPDEQPNDELRARINKVLHSHLSPLLAGDAMRSKYKDYRRMLDEAQIREADLKAAYDDNEKIRAATVEELHGVYSQLADLKEQAAIMDSIHKETMEKLERYEKTLKEIAEECNVTAHGEILIFKAQEVLRYTAK